MRAITAQRPSGRGLRWSAVAPFADGAVLTFAVVVERIGQPNNLLSLPLGAFLLFPPLTILLLGAAHAYRPRLRAQLLDDVRTITGATAIAAMTTVTASVVVAHEAGVAAQGVRLWLFATVYLAASRFGLTWSIVAARRAGDLGVRTLIVGAGAIGRTLARRFADHPELGLRPIGYLDKEPLVNEKLGVPDLPVLGASWDLPNLIARHRVEHVVFTFSTAPHHVLLRMIDDCTSRGVRVTLVPRLFEKMPSDLSVEHVGGIPLVSIHPTDPRGGSFALKYAFDRVAAAVVLLVIAPLLAAIAVAVRVTLGRPILFRQRRVGRDGEPFEMLKFRTMREATGASRPVDLPEDVAPGGSEGGDRVTRLGALLRHTSLDELPQLVNVLRGEMTLVGPRPERPEFVERFERDVHRYGERHRVKAGMTGWAQVHGLRGNTSLSERAEWDNYYIENASFWLDLKILLMTIVSVVRPPTAAAASEITEARTAQKRLAA